ncbi:Uncharacterised protein [Legionella busanensis]|uniref:Uncharacterized protein n=1 Tax=Legionella busanensis TaxID=190655 RepID=A0A378JM43_9GAMM|nr:hypothetical protein [Legionella busanensis]STX52157.1 Uncharacterised protein [Legionella busanensis]
MPFKNFIDSRGQTHSIYMQERVSSCAVACIANIIKLIGEDNCVNEAYLRLVTQQFVFGYKSHPAEVKADRRTFIAELIEQRQLAGMLNPGGNSIQRRGMQSEAIIKTLALYNLYSDIKELDEISHANKFNYKENLKSKIIMLGVKTTNQCDHCIIVRDIWDDGTWIIYDPAIGLIETQNVESHYNLFAHATHLNCPYVVSAEKVKVLDLEIGAMPPDPNEAFAMRVGV